MTDTIVDKKKVDKNIVIKSSIYTDKLIRTEITYNNSLLHAIFCAYSPEYLDINVDMRKQVVSKFSNIIIDTLCKNKLQWASYTCHYKIKVMFQEHIYNLINNLYTCIQNYDNTKLKIDIEAMKILK